MVSESRFNRLLHRIIQSDWQGILELLSRQSPATAFAIDSCPSPICWEVHAPHRRLYTDAQAGFESEIFAIFVCYAILTFAEGPYPKGEPVPSGSPRRYGYQT
jgi:hypothetical protein